MKIATYNINNINKRLDGLLRWLDESRPDVVCLQELKTLGPAFPIDAIREAGYGAVWRGQKTWNGVAILARGEAPMESRRVLPGDPADKQARYIEAAVEGLLVGCLYAPNGNPRPGPKFDYKLEWLARLAAHASKLCTSGLPVVLAGDYNIVPSESDIYPRHSWADDALLAPEARKAYAALLEQGWTDGLRHGHPERAPYTFWSYLRKRWPNDKGLRIDHLLVSPALAPRLRSAGVDRDARGWENASDHAPAWIVLD